MKNAELMAECEELKLQRRTAPEAVEALVEDEVDVALLVPV